MSALGNNVRRIRKEVGISQQQVADATGMSKNTISNIETGKTAANSNSVLKISKALGCTVDELMKGVEEGWTGTEGDHINRLCEELKQLPDEGRKQIVHTLQALIVYWKYRQED
ncbi:helix-turn-helix domain-containing protein [Microbulbifer sp. DLAB2-AA]|uniref:helix-turn-helix domain-containing protein n=1 Tax=Microbulbifer sp. DLAB2-AA TaxID=3243394 RepID=UPI004039BC7B